ncbi:hypothetical protein H1R20_g15296, partial [Candolleomyces eurysporus]
MNQFHEEQDSPTTSSSHTDLDSSPFAPASPLVIWGNPNHRASIAYSTPDGATQRIRETIYAGHLSASHSISARPREETQIFESPVGVVNNLPSVALLPSTYVMSSTAFLDVVTQRQYTSFRLRHIDIEIEAAEAHLAQLQKQRLQLVKLLAYNGEKV